MNKSKEYVKALRKHSKAEQKLQALNNAKRPNKKKIEKCSKEIEKYSKVIEMQLKEWRQELLSSSIPDPFGVKLYDAALKSLKDPTVVHVSQEDGATVLSVATEDKPQSVATEDKPQSVATEDKPHHSVTKDDRSR